MVSVTHLKGGALFGTFGGYYYQGVKDYREIGLCGFNYKLFEEYYAEGGPRPNIWVSIFEEPN